MHREGFEPSERKPRQFYRLLALADGERCRNFVRTTCGSGWVSIKINLCKNEKGRDLGTLRA